MREGTGYKAAGFYPAPSWFNSSVAFHSRLGQWESPRLQIEGRAFDSLTCCHLCAVLVYRYDGELVPPKTRLDS